MNTKNYLHNYCIIIPTLSNHEGLKNLLNDFERLYPNSRIIIVNNAKQHLSHDVITGKKLEVLTLDEKKNTGFAKACNDGAKAAKKHFQPDYLVFVNDDVHFSTDWLTPLINQALEKKWHAAAPLLHNLEGDIENFGYLVLPEGKIKLIQHASTSLPDGLTAAVLLIDASSFFKLNGFDERFFAYLEDVDLFLRMKKAGMKYGIATELKILHYGHQTSLNMRVNKAWLDTRNWYLLLSKHWTKEQLWKYFPAIVMERLRNLSGLLKSFF